MEVYEFHWVDWTVFVVTLAVSLGIGLYLGCFGSRQKTVAEYVFGNRQMATIPIAVSVALSLISGVTMLALPAEIYVYGFQVAMMTFGFIIVYFVTSYIFLPVYFTMGTSSGFMYLEKRFNKKVRIITSVLFVVQSVLQLPVIMYVPALAFNQVTGINVHVINSVALLICVTYTTLGGLKGVVWADMVQVFMVIGACMSVMILGFATVGFSNVWVRAAEGQRLNVFNLHPSPFIRNSFWLSVFANSVHWIAKISIDQSNIQKFKSVPTLKQARRVMFWMCIIAAFLTISACLLGIVLYAHYYKCDPIKNQRIMKSDQLVPLFVMETMRQVVGVPGIFVAGLFSAALSTTSAKLNTIGATIYNDFVITYMRRDLPEFSAGLIMKGSVVLCGTMTWGMVFVIERLGEILQINYLMDGITEGAVLGLFILGVLFPKCNTRGALFGAASSVIVMSIICIGAQISASSGYRAFQLPTSVDECPITSSNNSSSTALFHVEEPFILFQLSYMSYALVGSVITIVVGFLISVSSAENELTQTPVSNNLICPIVNSFQWSRRPRTISKSVPEVVVRPI